MNLKHALNRAALYGLSIALMRGVSLFMLPFVTGQLDQKSVGQLELLSSIAFFGSVIVGLGLEEALYRFCGLQQNEDKKKRIAGLIYVVSAATSIVIFLVFLGVAAHYTHSGGTLLRFSSIALVLTTIAFEGLIAIPMGWMRMQDRATLYCTINVLRCIIQASLVWLFLRAEFGLNGVLCAGVISVMMCAAILFFIQLRSSSLNLDLNEARAILYYSLPLVGSGLLAFFLNGFDRWFIGTKLSLEELALYGIAAKFALALAILIQPLGMWWSPIRFQLLAAQNGEQQLAKFSVLGMFVVTGGLFVVGYSAPYLINALLPSHYHAAVELIPLALLAIALKEIAEFCSLGTLHEHSTARQLHINIIAALLGVLSILALAKILGMRGVLAAVVLTQAARSLLLFTASQQRLPLPLPMLRISMLLGITTWLVYQHSLNSLSHESIFGSALAFIHDGFYLALAALFLFIPEATKVYRQQYRLVRACSHDA